MAKYCYCCGKQVKFLDSDLANGRICDGCFEKVHEIDNSITRSKLIKYNGEYIKQLTKSKEETVTQITVEPFAETMTEKAEKIHFKAVKNAAILAVTLVAFGILGELSDVLDKIKKGDFSDASTTQTSVVEKKRKANEYVELLKIASRQERLHR